MAEPDGTAESVAVALDDEVALEELDPLELELAVADELDVGVVLAEPDAADESVAVALDDEVALDEDEDEDDLVDEDEDELVAVALPEPEAVALDEPDELEEEELVMLEVAEAEEVAVALDVAPSMQKMCNPTTVCVYALVSHTEQYVAKFAVAGHVRAPPFAPVSVAPAPHGTHTGVAESSF